MTEIKTDTFDIPNDMVDVKGFQLQSIVGMKKEAAIKALDANKREWRILQEDDEVKQVIQDFKTGRVGLFLIKGVVSSFRLG
jgi:hypothetical protein